MPVPPPTTNAFCPDKLMVETIDAQTARHNRGLPNGLGLERLSS
jgi:hypothetical protein